MASMIFFVCAIQNKQKTIFQLHFCNIMNWDDLRLIQAIGDAGSMAGAARALELDYSTVFRRLNALEKDLSTRLFERTRTACTATLAGERMLGAATAVRESVDSALLEIAGQDARLTGIIRVTTTPSLAQALIIPLLGGFRERFPGIRVELHESYAVFDLMHREADIAVRFTSKPPETLVGTSLGTAGSAVFAAPDYWQKHGDRPLSELDWIVPTEESCSRGERRWLQRNVADDRIVMRANTGPAALVAVQNGLGVTILVRYMGVAGGLREISQPLPELDEQIWLLTHPNLRAVARVRAFFEYMREQLTVALVPHGGSKKPPAERQ